MSETYLTIEREDVPGWRVRLEVDDFDPESPRTWNNLGIMWARHRDYILGDAILGRYTPSEFDDLGRFIDDRSNRVEAIVKHCMRSFGATVVMPLYLLDHSGLSMSAGENLVPAVLRRRAVGRPLHAPFISDPQGWDTSAVGFIFDTERTRNECGTSLEHIEKALRGEVKVYDQYLRGDVYGVVLEQAVTVTTVTAIQRGASRIGEAISMSESKTAEWEEVESCWGFYGIDDAEREANDWLDSVRDRGAA